MTTAEYNAILANRGKPVAAAKREPVARGMNKWEASYAVMLEAQRKAGEIIWWDFERIRIRVGKGAWFKPDFFVILAGGSVEWHECKGYRREAAIVRIKAAADLIPLPFFIVTPKNGGWLKTRI